MQQIEPGGFPRGFPDGKFRGLQPLRKMGRRKAQHRVPLPVEEKRNPRYLFPVQLRQKKRPVVLRSLIGPAAFAVPRQESAQQLRSRWRLSRLRMRRTPCG